MRSIVYYYTHVERPFAMLADMLSSDPGLWLPPPATPVDGSDDTWLVHLRAEGALPVLVGGQTGHPTHVRVGPPAMSDTKGLRSVAWRSATAERLVPVLEADLELVPLTGYGCQLSLMGSYRPPLSVVGEVGDRLVGHRVAEACVRRFVLDTAERLERALQQT